MKITYVFHSCFVVENENFTLVFDFYKDTPNGFVKLYLPRFKTPVYVFCSHGHADHFNPEIETWKSLCSDIRYVLSKDIVDDGLCRLKNITVLDKGDVYIDENLKVTAFGSTDKGISFLLEFAGKKLFFAGDLNNWHWAAESTVEEVFEAENFYQNELALLASAVSELDVCFFPVDHRLGNNYAKGAEQLLEKIAVGLFVPMHFWENYQSVEAFALQAKRFGCGYWNIQKSGENI